MIILAFPSFHVFNIPKDAGFAGYGGQQGGYGGGGGYDQGGQGGFGGGQQGELSDCLCAAHDLLKPQACSEYTGLKTDCYLTVFKKMKHLCHASHHLSACFNAM